MASKKPFSSLKQPGCNTAYLEDQARQLNDKLRPVNEQLNSRATFRDTAYWKQAVVL